MSDDGRAKFGPSQTAKATTPAREGAPGAGVLPEGSRFGSYVIGACIGHGGMARIYRAEHEGLRRHVALKVLNEGFAQDREGHARFLREARIAAAIRHPNVVNIFDVGVRNSVPYLVMELLEGEDLETMLRTEGALSEAALVDIAVPIASGLSAVHDAGFVHRDLKPGNIYLARGRNDEVEPKLLDFGISRAAESKPFRLTTIRGLLIGTPQYMSPEALRGDEITALSDQYSLGVVLYECATGFNPFATDALSETARRVMIGQFAPPSQYNPALSRRLARVIERAMSLDPNERFKDLREMGRELLSMAGRRTRITWSLSFGEVAAEREIGTPAGAVEARTARNNVPNNAPNNTPARHAVAPWSERHLWRYRAAWVAGLFGLVTLAAAAWISRSSERHLEPRGYALQPRPSPAPPASPPAASALPKQNVAPNAGAVELANPSGRPSSSPPKSAAQVEAGEDEAADERSNDSRVRERGEEATVERPARDVGASRAQHGRSSPRVAPSRPRPQPQPVAEAADEPEEPDWVIPIDPPRKARSRRAPPPVGTNSAPILE